MSFIHYILNEDGTVTGVDFYDEKHSEEANAELRERWTTCMKTRNIIAGQPVGPTFVSTVFLGIDHHGLGGRPSLFETMVICSKELELPKIDRLDAEDHQQYSTLEEAKAGHATIVAALRERFGVES